MDYADLSLVAASAVLAKRLTETPTNHLDTSSYLEKVRGITASLVSEGFPVKLEVIQGTELQTRGFGGLWSVGKAAENPPALAILSFTPEKAAKTVALVGKGIVYDTGGLSIKTPTTYMCGMKADMGGSAAVISAFELYVKRSKGKSRLSRVYALLCLAENAVGPLSYRNDDIVRMYSGKTVEVNNTDAVCLI